MAERRAFPVIDHCEHEMLRVFKHKKQILMEFPEFIYVPHQETAF